MIQPSLLLRRALIADAIVTGAVALLQKIGAGQLRRCSTCLTRSSRNRPVSDCLTALVGWLGTRQSMPKALVAIVIAGNAAGRSAAWR